MAKTPTHRPDQSGSKEHGSVRLDENKSAPAQTTQKPKQGKLTTKADKSND